MFAAFSIVACLISNPQHCETFRDAPQVDSVSGEQMTFGTCLGIGGQTAAVQWSREHPGWKVAKYRCTPIRQPDDNKEDPLGVPT